MQLEITNIHNKGDHTKEYVLLKALEDCDVGSYALADATYTSDGELSNKCRHFYWFPDKNIKKGDLVSLRTSTGIDQEVKADNGTPIHRFYWGINKAVWNDEGDYAILYLVSKWKKYKVSEVK